MVAELELFAGQAEKVQASSEEEMRGVGRTRLAGEAKERVSEARVSMKAKEEELEGKEHGRSRTKFRRTTGKM